jgi:hypothetical protein
VLQPAGHSGNGDPRNWTGPGSRIWWGLDCSLAQVLAPGQEWHLSDSICGTAERAGVTVAGLLDLVHDSTRAGALPQEICSCCIVRFKPVPPGADSCSAENWRLKRPRRHSRMGAHE